MPTSALGKTCNSTGQPFGRRGQEISGRAADRGRMPTAIQTSGTACVQRPPTRPIRGRGGAMIDRPAPVVAKSSGSGPTFPSRVRLNLPAQIQDRHTMARLGTAPPSKFTISAWSRYNNAAGNWVSGCLVGGGLGAHSMHPVVGAFINEIFAMARPAELPRRDPAGADQNPGQGANRPKSSPKKSKAGNDPPAGTSNHPDRSSESGNVWQNTSSTRITRPSLSNLDAELTRTGPS
ncbi:hypothetical protein FQR65_LT20832 [Abscondita terminalis]|nr:hypothetical protein FQR65_LT20832 [Abscondita terminalis]